MDEETKVELTQEQIDQNADMAENVGEIKEKLIDLLIQDGRQTKIGVTAMAEIIAESSGTIANLQLALNHIVGVYGYIADQLIEKVKGKKK